MPHQTPHLGTQGTQALNGRQARASRGGLKPAAQPFAKALAAHSGRERQGLQIQPFSCLANFMVPINFKTHTFPQAPASSAQCSGWRARQGHRPVHRCGRCGQTASRTAGAGWRVLGAPQQEAGGIRARPALPDHVSAVRGRKKAQCWESGRPALSLPCCGSLSRSPFPPGLPLLPCLPSMTANTLGAVMGHRASYRARNLTSGPPAPQSSRVSSARCYSPLQPRGAAWGLGWGARRGPRGESLLYPVPPTVWPTLKGIRSLIHSTNMALSFRTKGHGSLAHRHVNMEGQEGSG